MYSAVACLVIMLKSPLSHNCKHHIIIHLKTIPYHETVSEVMRASYYWGVCVCVRSRGRRRKGRRRRGRRRRIRGGGGGGRGGEGGEEG